MSQQRLNILVTAIGGAGQGDQILKALRLAKNHSYRILGTDIDALCPQRSLVDYFETLPMATAPHYLDSVITLCKREDVDVIFVGCEPELIVLAHNRDHFQDLDIYLPIQPTPVIDLCIDKIATSTRLRELGWHTPESHRISELGDLDLVQRFPVVLKPVTGGGGSTGVHIAQSPTELRALWNFLIFETNIPAYMVQEYVGTPENEFTVGVLHDSAGTYINGIGLRRYLKGGLSVRLNTVNRTGREELGSRLVISTGISQGTIGRFDSVISQCREIAEGFESTGPMNIQCRVIDDQINVFEINPRLSGTTSMRALVGLNEPDLMIRRHVFGETMVQDELYQEAVIRRTLSEYIVT